MEGKKSQQYYCMTILFLGVTLYLELGQECTYMLGVMMHGQMRGMRHNIYTMLVRVWIDPNFCKRKIAVYLKTKTCFPLNLVISRKGVLYLNRK